MFHRWKCELEKGSVSNKCEDFCPSLEAQHVPADLPDEKAGIY